MNQPLNPTNAMEVDEDTNQSAQSAQSGASSSGMKQMADMTVKSEVRTSSNEKMPTPEPPIVENHAVQPPGIPGPGPQSVVGGPAIPVSSHQIPQPGFQQQPPPQQQQQQQPPPPAQNQPPPQN